MTITDLDRDMGVELNVTPLLEGSEDDMENSVHQRRPSVHVIGEKYQRPLPDGSQVSFGRGSPLGRLKQAVSKVLRNVTLEPMLFMKMLAESNAGVVADTLEIDRVCRVNLNYTEEECRNMDDGNHTTIQTEVQKYQNMFNYYQNLMDSILPLIIVVLIGSLTDKYGRKPPMLGVLAGFVGWSVVYILTALNPSWPVEVLLGATLCGDIMGTWVVFNMAVYSYMADITTPETRTKRMGFLDVVWYIGGPLGRLMGGWLYRWTNCIVVFAVSGALWTLCFLYVLFLVKESVNPLASSSDPEDERCSNWGPLKPVFILFNTGFKKRPGNRRSLLFYLLMLKLMVFLIQGHQMYLWARRVLQWGPTEFSTWSSIDSTIHMSGTVVWLLIASHFKLHETIVAIGGIISQGFWCGLLACISGPGLWWLVIVASVIGMFEETIEPAIRTMLTVVVDENEKGKILALNGLLESAWLAADRSMYTALYNTFVEVFPQINFVVQAGICVILVLVFSYLYILFKRQPLTAPSIENFQNIVDTDACETVEEQGSGRTGVY
ncbi:probable peptidoglycan muropeptide transporter SLC46 isoform X2 [Macrobrachium nipponense]|uniref:probable peptidoglycan muropeptide transporter SLC46 isoform X2 n=1 Tax=Macrobrachium nipponense TaxID=159736 RepID=UPI0030C85321